MSAAPPRAGDDAGVGAKPAMKGIVTALQRGYTVQQPGLNIKMIKFIRRSG